MAKYKEAKVSQLRLKEIPDNISLERFTYTMTATSPEVKKQYDSGKPRYFDKNKTTHKIEVGFDTTEVKVNVYLDGKPRKTIILQHFDKKLGSLNLFSLKSTSSLNSESTGHLKELQVSANAEVGWLLVKKEQTFDSLLKLIYKKVPTRTELDIFRHANAHISDLQDLNLNNKVKPGQIVLVTNKKNSRELTEYKKLALEAEKQYQYLSKNNNFDAKFYANNFELIQNYLAFAREVQVAQMEYQKTVQGHKEVYCEPITLNKEAESLNGVGIYSQNTKEAFDKLNIKTVREDLLKQVTQQSELLQKRYKLEVLDKNGGKNNFQLDKIFRQKYAKDYKNLQNTINKNFAVNHNNQNFEKILKNIVKDTANLRGEKFMGGLKLHVNAINDVGRATIALKLGQNIVLSFYVAESLTKIHGAYQTGDTDYTVKVVVNESLKISGGFIGGYYGATLGGAIATGILILGSVATGGVLAVIVVGAGAVAGGVVGGYYGTIVGDKVGNGLMEICE